MIKTTQQFIDYARSNVVTTSAKVIIHSQNVKENFWEIGKYAIFENKGISLDGSECVISPNFEIEGWYSNEISDENGNVKNVEYAEHFSEGGKLTILFSSIRNEYAINFDVTIMNLESGDSVTHEYTNTTNNKVEIETINENALVTIKIYKWSMPNAHCKILNVYTGTVYIYEDNEIVSITAKKGASLTNDEIETKTAEITLVDYENKYNIFNENTELAGLKETDNISVYVGLLIEKYIYYVKIDQFYFKNIQKKENALEVIINAEGALAKYKNINWVNNVNEVYLTELSLLWYLNRFKGALAQVEIDESIQDIKVYPFFKKEDSMYEIFSNLATIAKANIFENVDNKILIKEIKENEPIATINLNNMEEYPTIEKKEENANIIVKLYTHSKDTEQQELAHVKFDKSSITFEKKENRYCYWKINYNTNKDLAWIQDIQGDIEYEVKIYNSDGTLCNKALSDESYVLGTLTNFSFILSGDDYTNLIDKTFEIIIKGKTINFNNIELKKDNNVANDKTIDIRSIENSAQANEISEWLTDNLNKKFYYKIKLHDAFTYEIGDTVRIETGIYDENGESIIKEAIITEIEYAYNGALEYYIYLRGK